MCSRVGVSVFASSLATGGSLGAAHCWAEQVRAVALLAVLAKSKIHVWRAHHNQVGAGYMTCTLVVRGMPQLAAPRMLLTLLAERVVSSFVQLMQHYPVCCAVSQALSSVLQSLPITNLLCGRHVFLPNLAPLWEMLSQPG